MLLIDFPQRLLMVTFRGKKMFSLIHFVPHYKIPKIKICHMFASKHPEVIEGRRRLIATDATESKEAYENVSIDDDGFDLDEEDGSGLGEAGVQTGVTQSGT